MQQVEIIQTTPQQLEMLVKKAVAEVLNAPKPQPQDTEDPLLLKEEVAKMLKISKETVKRYRQKGILKSYGVGRRVYFKKSEVEKAVLILNS